MTEDVKQDELLAAYAYVDEMVPKASGVIHGGPVWHGWALREAYLAGVKAERERCTGIVMAHCAADGKMDCAPLFNAAAAIRAGHSITETPLGEG